MEAEDDEALARRAGAGERAALEALLRRHYDGVFRLAYRFCRHPEDARDVAQEACLRVARGIGAFDGRSAFRTWLYRIVVNLVRDRRRRARGEPLPLEDAVIVDGALGADGTPSPQRALELQRAWAELDSLTPEQREAVLLVHVEGLSHREAGRVLACAETTVSWRIFQARRRLRAGTDPFADEVTA